MKTIKAISAPAFVRHLGVISKLAGENCPPYPFDTWAKLQRLEAAATRITTNECNGVYLTELDQERADKALDRIKLKVCQLLPNARTIFINGDPRGYALKIKESEAKELGIYQDCGGYGILCPSF